MIYRVVERVEEEAGPPPASAVEATEGSDVRG
jgi:hypothetical protein